jgi:hypothetical protein
VQPRVGPQHRGGVRTGVSGQCLSASALSCLQFNEEQDKKGEMNRKV